MSSIIGGNGIYSYVDNGYVVGLPRYGLQSVPVDTVVIEYTKTTD